MAIISVRIFRKCCSPGTFGRLCCAVAWQVFFFLGLGHIAFVREFSSPSAAANTGCPTDRVPPPLPHSPPNIPSIGNKQTNFAPRLGLRCSTSLVSRHAAGKGNKNIVFSLELLVALYPPIYVCVCVCVSVYVWGS